MAKQNTRARLFRIFLWITTGIIALIVLATILSYAASVPLRNFLENNANGHLKSYAIHIGKARFHPIGFSLDLYELIITQKAKPNPPVANIPHLNANVHWSQLIWGHLVADFKIDQPKIHFDLKNVQEEQQNNLPIKREGWQQALESIYPLKIDTFTVLNADLTYRDRGPYKSLRMSHLNMFARNIRNIQSPEHVYPSSVHLDGIIFGTGKFSLDGNANFLAEPHATVKAEFSLEKMELEYFKPITDRFNLAVTGGHLSTVGNLEYATKEQIYQLKELTIEGVKADYIHLAQTARAEKQRAKEAAESAKELSNKPTVTTEITRLKVTNGDFGFVNKAVNPQYRVLTTETEISIQNFSNQFLKGPATLRLTGKFMGSGFTEANGIFRPEKNGPDFALKIAIEQAKLKPMSDLFRAYGNFTVEGGLFSFYSELAVKGRTANGYVKPMFTDMEVTDKRTKHEKNLFHKLYVGIVGAVSELLENRQEKVATKTNISGPLEGPRMNTWQAIQRLVQNAFFRAILPGFSESIPASEK